ncbi:unnamed protein product [Sphenostylis stenocarpa]|uniref:Uncharacterized protein n=1 Tax=Sphenostylis stenocarpa TaxID=92480 RepID=A0AA86W613_9FABA|nr:unnamed protein product [Sphenostylis stenocarpa]
MDNNRSPLLSWACYCHGKSMEELKQSLMYTALELEQTRASVQEELRKRDDQLLSLKELLNKVIRERDEAQEKWQRLVLEKMVFQQQKQQHQTAPASGISSIEDEPRRGIDSNNGLSSSDCEESIVSSPVMEHLGQAPHAGRAQPQLPESMIELISPDKPLPEKGKLLQAVMKAGPLLQTLLLAGPLPQWRHPPPPLESFEIPPVTIPSPQPQPQPQTQGQAQFLHQDSFTSNCGRVSRKRVFCEGSDSPTQTKFQRIVLH